MCVDMKAVDCIIQERFLLEDIQNEIKKSNLRYAFQDDENLFMVIDLMLGGDLRYLLNTKGPLSEELVQFYMAECALGISYLHSKNIVHRDLKPDNSCETGHATLTDFNIATKFKPGKLMKSEAGSPAYMAPEMFDRKGYSENIDWWSLGIIKYELLHAKRPFESNSSEGLKKAIQSESLVFQKTTREISELCKSAISEFLQKDPSMRLCGKEKISQHEFYKNLDWEKLERQEVKPPFVPDTKNINCDFTHELEEILVNDNPLVAKSRKPGENKYAHLGAEIAKEYEKMEIQFLNFDFTKPSSNKELKDKILGETKPKEDDETIKSRLSGRTNNGDQVQSKSETPMSMNLPELPSIAADVQAPLPAPDIPVVKIEVISENIQGLASKTITKDKTSS
ncbi:hypothetical protein HK100_007712 [Physocladia obscura]|uniref:Uncharacterized protein n=1 Tax=Physocladia obscura TaxID=109957 RepID=A0AAD5SP96_9FUNG|nr:hypothetical protein HK100_007712 [Physocladia obscura]